MNLPSAVRETAPMGFTQKEMVQSPPLACESAVNCRTCSASKAHCSWIAASSCSQSRRSRRRALAG
eukprot:3479502-Rhodomonas_salina.1